MQPARSRAAAIALTLFLGWLDPSVRATNAVVLAWNQATLEAIRFANTPPPAAARHLALVHLALFDAANAIDGRYANYRPQHGAPKSASPQAAAAAAANTILRLTYPPFTVTWDAMLQSQLLALPDGSAESEGVSWGRSVARRLLEEREFDGSNFGVDYRPFGSPGHWEPTPSLFASALLPQWPGVIPFGLRSGDQFRPPPPPGLETEEWARDLEEVRTLGAETSVLRTSEQTEIAWFWADGPGTETPPGHWNSIARQVAERRDLDLVEAARLFALLNAALADAGIASWDAKYAYDLWRPITAIRKADLDGNPATLPDPAWRPLISTPPFPEYVSGHSTFSAAAAAVLSDFCGTDGFPFTLPSDGLFQATRSWQRFSEAALEAGRSRVYGGIHFSAANREGYRLGNEVGVWTSRNLLLSRARAAITLERGSNHLILRWPTGARLEACGSLATPDWRIVPGNGETLIPITAPPGFFRLSLQ
jgi:hypothetical protein